MCDRNYIYLFPLINLHATCQPLLSFFFLILSLSMCHTAEHPCLLTVYQFQHGLWKADSTMSLNQIHFSVTAKHKAIHGRSVLSRLFLLTIIFIYIFSIYWSVLAQTLTPYEACLPLYLNGLISLPSPIMMFIQSILRVLGHSAHTN